MQVCILSPRLDQRLLLISRTLELNGAEIEIVTDWKSDTEDYDHNTIVKYYHNDGFRSSDISNTSARASDLLVCDWQPKWKSYRCLYRSWISKSKRTAILYRRISHNLIKRFASEVKLLITCPEVLCIHVVLTEDLDPALSLLTLWARGHYIGATPRPWAMCNDSHFKRLFTPVDDLTTNRRFILNFCGSNRPSRRGKIINELEKEFRGETELQILTRASQFNSAIKAPVIVWGVANQAEERVSRGEYIDLLSQSDFTFCLSGYTGTTTRVLEAMCRSSIPILPFEERNYYEVPLVDGQNCILVNTDRDWPKAYWRIRQLDSNKIKEMRESTHQSSQKHLRWDVLQKSLLHKLLQ